MIRKVSMILFLVLTAMTAVCFANLDDNRSTIAAQYGDFRMVIDTDNQPWTKDDWELKGKKRAKASSFVHYFSRNDLGIQMEVLYDSDGPKAMVYAQRFTPNMPIKIKDFKSYFPEVYQLITNNKAQVFASYEAVTRQFREDQSPVTLGVVVKSPIPGKTAYCTLVAFNIQDEGRLIKDIKYIDENTYIREFTIERVLRSTANESLDGKWVGIKNYF